MSRASLNWRKPIRWRVWGKGVWFRVLGYGACIERTKGRKPSFSERQGLKQVFRFAGLTIEPLGKK